MKPTNLIKEKLITVLAGGAFITLMSIAIPDLIESDRKRLESYSQLPNCETFDTPEITLGERVVFCYYSTNLRSLDRLADQRHNEYRTDLEYRDQVHRELEACIKNEDRYVGIFMCKTHEGYPSFAPRVKPGPEAYFLRPEILDPNSQK